MNKRWLTPCTNELLRSAVTFYQDLFSRCSSLTCQISRSSPAGRSFNSGSYPFPNTVRRSRFYDIPTQSLAVESWMASRNKGTFLRIWPTTAQSSSYDCSYNMGGLLIHQGVGFSSQHGLRCSISIQARLKDAFTKCHRLPFPLLSLFHTAYEFHCSC